MPEPDPLDLKMPLVDGFDVLRWLQLSDLDAPPVLVLSGSNLDGDRKRALQLGAREFHVKSPDVARTRRFICERCLGQLA
jgi:CheY-like chemotaxis protein